MYTTNVWVFFAYMGVAAAFLFGALFTGIRREIREDAMTRIEHDLARNVCVATVAQLDGCWASVQPRERMVTWPQLLTICATILLSPPLAFIIAWAIH